MKKQNIYQLFLFLTLTACASYVPQRDPSAAKSPDYPKIFQRARENLIATGADKAKSKVYEHRFVGYLAENPAWIDEDPSRLVTDVQSASSAQDARVVASKDPNEKERNKFTRLIPPSGKSGYENVKVYVSHPYYLNGALHPKDNMVKAWIDFIKTAKKEIILNVFDFDIQEVAQVLVDKASKGVKVTVGIDKGVNAARPEVQAVVAILQKGGVKVTLVNSVGLNHQKVTAIDWSDENAASILFSSGNLTRSCIDPDGDLKGTVPLPPESVPNANHLITMKSWLLSNLVRHELTKTLDDKFLLRGKQYPITGAYQVTGPGVDPQTSEPYPEPSLVITFAPNGGIKNINKSLIADVLLREKGAIRMIQFAFSSTFVEEALLARATSDIKATGKFDFMSVGDTPFAMREWSRFLVMSGYKLDIQAKKKTYLDDKDGKWWAALGEQQINTLRKKVYAAPAVYGEHHLKINGQSVKANGKIHHKILATPNYAIVGTSFNFSAGAESNNEQLLVFRDKSMSRLVDGMLKHLVSGSRGTVASETVRRNSMRIPDDEGGDDVEDNQGN